MSVAIVHPEDIDPGHPLSVAGDFYVEDGYCLSCGVPEAIAPELISHAEDQHCYWKKQPDTQLELQKAIQILHAQELGCHRYRGNDPAILKSLPPSCCDAVCPVAPRRTKNWNLGRGPGVSFALTQAENLVKRIWRRVSGG